MSIPGAPEISKFLRMISSQLKAIKPISEPTDICESSIMKLPSIDSNRTVESPTNEGVFKPLTWPVTPIRARPSSIPSLIVTLLNSTSESRIQAASPLQFVNSTPSKTIFASGLWDWMHIEPASRR